MYPNQSLSLSVSLPLPVSGSLPLRCICVTRSTHLCTSTEARGPMGVLLYSFLLPSLENRFSHWIQSLPFQIDWLAIKTQWSSCLRPHSTGHTGTHGHIVLFTLILKIWTQVSCLCSTHYCPLSHLPRPWMLLHLNHWPLWENNKSSRLCLTRGQAYSFTSFPTLLGACG